MFKKIAVFLIGVIMLPSAALAQKDWANVVKYAQANTEVTGKPVAVLMGDSITEGWFKKDINRNFKRFLIKFCNFI